MKKQIAVVGQPDTRAIINALAMCDELREAIQKMKNDGASKAQVERMCKRFIGEVYGEQAAIEPAKENQ